MSHITLEEYIASLPQSLSETQKVEKANEWKQTHQPKQDEVEVEEVETKEEVKEPAVAEKDTTVTAEYDCNSRDNRSIRTFRFWRWQADFCFNVRQRCNK